jgi:hypothetical protein
VSPPVGAMALDANVEALCAGEISFDEFRSRQRKTWDAIEANGATDTTLAVLRGRLPFITRKT